MSQHDMNIANQGFPAFRSDLNNALAALASTSTGATEPSTTFAQQLWYDSTANLLKMRNTDNDAWITLAYFDQTNDEWQIRSAVIQAVDSAGVTIKTDDGTARITVNDNGTVDFANDIDVTGTVTADLLTVDGTGSSNFTSTATSPVQINGTSIPTLTVRNSTTPVETQVRATTTEGLVRTATNHPLVFGTSASERMRIDTSGNLLVGKTSTGSATVGCEVRPIGLMVNTRDDGIPTVINRLTSDGTIIELVKDNAPVGTIGAVSGDMYLGTDNTGFRFVNAGSDIRPFDPSSGSTRDGAIDLGDSSARWADLYLSGGVYLGGTGSANKLEDYEEGTFTVSLTPVTSGSFTMDSDRDTLQYIKIGNMVHIMGYVRVSSVSSPVGSISFTVPFTPANLDEYAGYYTGVALPENLGSGNSNEFGLLLNENNTTVYIYRTGAGGTAASWVVSAQTFQAATNVRIVLTYKAA